MAKQNTRIKILFILPSLRAGGAERVISFIATHLNKQKFKSILVVVGNAEDAVYKIKGIEVHFLNKKRVLTAIPKLFRYILIANPKIVVGSISHVNRVIAVFSLLFPKIKFIGREASVLSIMKKFPTVNRKIVNPFFKKYHRYLDIVICQSNDMLNDIKKYNNIEKSKLVVINNPITDDFQLKKDDTYPKTDLIKYITVGTLHERKGHIRLLNLLKKVNHSFHYTIIGSGDELENLNNCIKKLNLFDKITLIPYTSNVSEYLKESDVFLNGSYVEGFPNVLLESCAVGTPVIAFDAPGGINEIILDGVNGFIVRSENEYIQNLNRINNMYNFKPKIVCKSVTSRYSKEYILSKYEDLFENLVNKKPFR
ncbi:glycosyltransferase [bacterium AH-315-P13]|nr:glycosyltransferase [bacterium AH-315-P13]